MNYDFSFFDYFVLLCPNVHVFPCEFEVQSLVLLRFLQMVIIREREGGREGEGKREGIWNYPEYAERADVS